MKKLILHRATMKYYENYLNKDYKIKYINYNQKYKIPKHQKYQIL